MPLTLYTDDSELKQVYESMISKWMQRSPRDHGFDIPFPKDAHILNNKPSTRVDLGVIAVYTTEDGTPLPFDLIPRSSISKTFLTMPNSPGLIDAGYRGNLMVALRTEVNTTCKRYESIVQIAPRGDTPFGDIFIKDTFELDKTTDRGDGGFGSTGK